MDKDFIEYLGYKASGPEIDLLTFDSYLITAWSVFILLKYLQAEPRAALRTFAEPDQTGVLAIAPAELWHRTRIKR